MHCAEKCLIYRREHDSQIAVFDRSICFHRREASSISQSFFLNLMNLEKSFIHDHKKFVQILRVSLAYR